MKHCIGCGKKGVHWPKDEPLACSMRCLVNGWFCLREAAGYIEGEHCSDCGEQIQNYGHECIEEER